jgi:hypothetical protein
MLQTLFKNDLVDELSLTIPPKHWANENALSPIPASFKVTTGLPGLAIAMEQEFTIFA